MNKTLSVAEAVSELRDGMTIGIGGWGARRKPMAMVREIMRSPLKDLTVVSYGLSSLSFHQSLPQQLHLAIGYHPASDGRSP
jgi:acyl CoA:acetate/3-ketoacid CoA transferase alpha subunit